MQTVAAKSVYRLMHITVIKQYIQITGKRDWNNNSFIYINQYRS